MFFAATFLWAWIVHWAARHVLRLDDWVPDAHVPGGITPARRAAALAIAHNDEPRQTIVIDCIREVKAPH